MPQPSATNRKSPPFRAPRPPARRGPGSHAGAGPAKPEHEILFQTYFKSVGPRTYAAQVKRASNDNHYLVLTEGKRDDKTSEVRKTRLFIYSEDFIVFFRMLQETAQFIKANPVPDEVKEKRDRFWAKKEHEAKAAPSAPPPVVPASRQAPPAIAAAGGNARVAGVATAVAKSPGAVATLRDHRPAPAAQKPLRPGV